MKFKNAKNLIILFFAEFKRLHVWLIRYRALAILVTFFCGWLCLDAWQFYKAHYSEFKNFDAAGGIGPFLLAFLGALKWSFENVQHRQMRNENDDDDN